MPGQTNSTNAEKKNKRKKHPQTERDFLELFHHKIIRNTSSYRNKKAMAEGEKWEIISHVYFPYIS